MNEREFLRKNWQPRKADKELQGHTIKAMKVVEHIKAMIAANTPKDFFDARMALRILKIDSSGHLGNYQIKLKITKFENEHQDLFPRQNETVPDGRRIKYRSARRHIKTMFGDSKPGEFRRSHEALSILKLDALGLLGDEIINEEIKTFEENFFRNLTESETEDQ